MQVNRMGGVPSYNPYSQANTASRFRNVQMPVFGNGFKNMMTHRETCRTDDEIKNSIIELAKKDAAAGIHGRSIDDFSTPSQEFQDLLHEYVGSVSPDRRAIFPAGIAQLQKATSLRANAPYIDDSIMQLWLSGSKISLRNYNVQYSARDKMMEVGKVDFFENGEFIGTYSNDHGWGYCYTKAEQSRSEEIHHLYVDTWKAERNALGLELF